MSMSRAASWSRFVIVDGAFDPLSWAPDSPA
jgi:hypothetical protein